MSSDARDGIDAGGDDLRDGIDTGSSGEASGFDLSPRERDVAAEVRRERARRGRGAMIAVGVVLAAVVGVVLVQGLGNATLYFRNADEAVEQRSDLGDRRFRLQGSVVGETIEESDGRVVFDVEYNDVRVPVRHEGDPPELFQSGIPVVLEGRWSDQGDWFDSSLMIVKHTNEYEADYGERLDQAEQGGEPAP